jgi:hypothetical protein
MRDRDLYVAEGPSQLVYDDPEAMFEAPEGRYVWMAVAAGRIMELIAGVTEHALTLDEAHERALRVARTLSSLPLVEEQPMELSLAELHEEMERATSERHEIPLARYTHRDVRWAFRLRRLGPVAPLPEDAYILTMRWSSETIEDELLEKVHEKRLAHGDKGKDLPLSVWMNDA